MATKKKAQELKLQQSPVVATPAARLVTEAMVNEKTRHGTVIAFSGYEYVRYEWRRVPAGFEEQAEKHPHLDVRVRNVTEEEIQEATEEQAVGAVTDETEASDEQTQDQTGDSQDSGDATDDESE